jgi:dephospho-CoA kinase
VKSQSKTYCSIGLTGGIACGKSEVQQTLLDLGVPVLDTDGVAHELLKAGTEQVNAIRSAFGDDVMAADGSVDRSRLGSRVFSDVTERKRLNAIMHPAIRSVWMNWLQTHRDRFAVVSIPLLFETGVESQFDGVLCIWSPEQLMINRLLQRGLTPEEAAHRIQAQWPVDRKAELATWTLQNDGTLEHLRKQVTDWVLQTRPETT